MDHVVIICSKSKTTLTKYTLMDHLIIICSKPKPWIKYTQMDHVAIICSKPKSKRANLTMQKYFARNDDRSKLRTYLIHF